MKKIPLVFFVGLMVASLFACSTSREKKITKEERAYSLIEIARGALSEGDAVGALQTLAAVERDMPDMPELHQAKALAFAAKRENNAAIAEAKIATTLRSRYPEAHLTLGKLLMDVGRHEEAIASLTIVAKDSLFRDAYKADSALGIIHYRRGNYDEALKHLNRAIAASPSLACIAYYYRGHIELNRDRVNNAVDDYGRASQKVCSNFLDAHYALGLAHKRNRSFDLARKKFLDVRQHSPDSTLGRKATEHLRHLQ